MNEYVIKFHNTSNTSALFTAYVKAININVAIKEFKVGMPGYSIVSVAKVG